MKQLIYLLPFLIFTSCYQSNNNLNSSSVNSNSSNQNFDTNISTRKQIAKEIATEDKQIEKYSKQSFSGFEKATSYKLTDTITADFNGDGIIDKAIYKKENQSSGIIIKHGQTNEVIKIGFGKQFAHMTEFDWVDYWGLVEDRETSETTFTDDGAVMESKNVKLQNPSIVLGKNEVGGGLITFFYGKYVWIHQTC